MMPNTTLQTLKYLNDDRLLKAFLILSKMLPEVCRCVES